MFLGKIGSKSYKNAQNHNDFGQNQRISILLFYPFNILSGFCINADQLAFIYK